MTTLVAPPGTVVIYQTASALPGMVELPLRSIGLRRGEHYLATDDLKTVKGALTHNTKLLIIGAHQSGGTDGLEELIGHARALNPGIRVVGYSVCKLDGLIIDLIINKSEEGSIAMMLAEVQQVILVA